jgi:hypothetical protein
MAIRSLIIVRKRTTHIAFGLLQGGNLITYESSPSVRTADLDTAKLHWNSVISTPGAQYMCLDIKIF